MKRRSQYPNPLGVSILAALIATTNFVGADTLARRGSLIKRTVWGESVTKGHPLGEPESPSGSAKAAARRSRRLPPATNISDSAHRRLLEEAMGGANMLDQVWAKYLRGLRNEYPARARQDFKSVQKSGGARGVFDSKVDLATMDSKGEAIIRYTEEAQSVTPSGRAGVIEFVTATDELGKFDVVEYPVHGGEGTSRLSTVAVSIDAPDKNTAIVELKGPSDGRHTVSVTRKIKISRGNDGKPRGEVSSVIWETTESMKLVRVKAAFSSQDKRSLILSKSYRSGAQPFDIEIELPHQVKGEKISLPVEIDVDPHGKRVSVYTDQGQHLEIPVFTDRNKSYEILDMRVGPQDDWILSKGLDVPKAELRPAKALTPLNIQVYQPSASTIVQPTNAAR